MKLVALGQLRFGELTFAVQQVTDQALPQALGHRLTVLPVLFRPFPSAPLLQAKDDLFQGLLQLRLIDRLEDIAAYAVGDGGFGIFKVRIAADNHDFKLRAEFPGLTDQIQTVAARHPNIGNQQMGLELLHHPEGLQPVFRLAHDLHVQRSPVDQRLDQPANQLLVIRNNNLPHKLPLFPRSRFSNKPPPVLRQSIHITLPFCSGNFNRNAGQPAFLLFVVYEITW